MSAQTAYHEATNSLNEIEKSLTEIATKEKKNLMNLKLKLFESSKKLGMQNTHDMTKNLDELISMHNDEVEMLNKKINGLKNDIIYNLENKINDLKKRLSKKTNDELRAELENEITKSNAALDAPNVKLAKKRGKKNLNLKNG